VLDGAGEHGLGGPDEGAPPTGKRVEQGDVGGRVAVDVVTDDPYPVVERGQHRLDLTDHEVVVVDDGYGDPVPRVVVVFG